jgi:hypothetical protein
MASKHSNKGNGALDLAWVKIQNGLQQEAEGHKLWMEGTLELINILDDARKHLDSDQEFGKWLTDNGYGEIRITRHDRSALLNMALDPNVTREVLAQTHRRSWRLIWEEEVKLKLPNVGQPPDAQKTEEAPTISRRPKKAKGAKTVEQEQENEWSADNRKWGSEVEVVANNAIRVAAFLKRCTPEKWRQLVLDVDPSLGARVRSVSEAWRELADALDEPLEKEANTLIQESRVKTTPATRPSRPAQTSAS